MDQKQENTPEEAKTNQAVDAWKCQSEEGTVTEVCSDAFHSPSFPVNPNGVTMLGDRFLRESHWPTGLLTISTHTVVPV